MARQPGLAALALGGVLVASSGCVAAGLAVLTTGAGIAGGQGTSYTLDGIAYRTFAASVEDVRRANLVALDRMDIALRSDETTPEGRQLEAEAGEWTVYIELEKLTPRATRMRITAKRGWFFRDRATSGEIIAQTERALDGVPAFSQTTR